MGIQPVQVMSSRAGANRPPRQRVPRPHVANATPVPSALTLDDVAAAVSELAADLFPGQGNEPLEPLDRFRRGLIADAAVVWAVRDLGG